MFRKPTSGIAIIDTVDTSVKTGLILRLKECVSEIVMKYTSESWVPLKNEEATNTLCWILEAVFIHGLKNTFIKSLFSSRRENSIPNPSFWDFVLLFSHRDLIEQIRKLNYVNTDVGRSRAWIRLTLNEMSLVSYLENMLRNPSYVRSFYKPSAFLRDSERCDILKNYLVGVVESCKFDLVVDNSLLNQWTSGPLSLVGLWMDDNVTQGIDVAQNMDSRDLQAIPQLGKPKTPEPQFMAALRRQPLLSEDDALRIIMASKPTSSNSAGASAASSRRNSDASQHGHGHGISIDPMPSLRVGSYTGGGNHHVPISQKQVPMPSPKVSPRDVSPKPVVKASSVPVGDKFPQNSQKSEPVKVEKKDEDAVPKLTPETELDTDAADNDNAAPSALEISQELSYADLLTSYQNKTVGVPIEGDINEFANASVKATSDNEGPSELDATTSSEELHLSNRFDGFELISAFQKEASTSSVMFPKITKFVGKIANEVGIDSQQYVCKFCQAPVGMSLAPARVCHFTGNYFCAGCHQEETNVIPARILLNWDFSLYSVCKVSNEFLESVKEEPLFDLEDINPKLYSFIDELAELRDLRTKLHYISMYLKTCKDDTVWNEFSKGVSSHLFEKVHHYSLSDLLNVTNRSLTTPLVKLFKFGKAHIVSCNICKAKGFVCEMCRNPEVIFPFNLKSIFKCRCCGAVYHSKCMSLTKPCPRCQRWKSTPTEDDFICTDESL